MTAQSGGGRQAVKQKVGGWFFRTIYRKGWPRWAMLAAALIVFALCALALTGGADFREDPSALVPRSADVYVETRDLPAFLKTVGAWQVWKEERRSTSEEERLQLLVDIAGLIGDRVAGMGTSSPLRWLTASSGAAYCVSAAPEEEGGASWALFLNMPDPAGALAEVGVERGMTVETVRGGGKDGGVFKLKGGGGDELYFGVVAPWLIISSQARLPEFALDSVRRPAFSLANAGLAPKWKRGNSARGVFNPAYRGAAGAAGLSAMLAGWVAPDVRITVRASIGANGLETTVGSELLSESVRGGGLWSLFSVVLFLLAVLALLIAFATLLTMIGWGGWLKARALKAGILPAAAPVPTASSKAFKEDAGLTSPSAAAANTRGESEEKLSASEAELKENSSDSLSGGTNNSADKDACDSSRDAPMADARAGADETPENSCCNADNCSGGKGADASVNDDETEAT